MGTLTWIRRINGTLGHLAPQTIANKMRRAFMTPRDLPLRDWELPLLAQSELGSGPRCAVDARLGRAADPVRQSDHCTGR